MRKRILFIIAVAFTGTRPSAAQELPEFSAGDTTAWYNIRFARGGLFLSASPDGGKLKTTVANDTRWQLVGTRDSFMLRNAEGAWACLDGTQFAATKDAAQRAAFRLLPAGNGSNTAAQENASGSGGTGGGAQGNASTGSGAWEIQRLGGGERSMNQIGTPHVGNTLGEWSAGDINNRLNFVRPESILPADYRTAGVSGYVPGHSLTLWYTEPATTARLYSGDSDGGEKFYDGVSGYSEWMEYSLPIGDGQFGASLFGGIRKDEIQFNDKTLWTGRSTDLSGGGWGYGEYKNFGSLYAEDLTGAFGYTDATTATDYCRQLDLTDATASVTFRDQAGTRYTRRYIASNPARVVVAHYEASRPGGISLRFTIGGGSVEGTPSYGEDGGSFGGRLETVSYNARFKVVPKGGRMTTGPAGVEVRGADEVLVVLGGGTDFDPYSDSYVSRTAELPADIAARVERAAARTWEDLLAEHVKDYKQYFDRVDFRLEGAANTVPTDELVRTYDNGRGRNALMLERLYFAYGRYLSISSSRGVDLPSNLQGIWNNVAAPAWNCDIHSNINVQMNYWPAEPTNLSEMHLPFLNYVCNMATGHPEWRRYASDIAGQERGWTCFTENNIFGGGSRFADSYVIANAWYCTHLWQHYRYTLDADYLRRVFPTMLAAAQFWMDRLRPAADGTYEAPNEWSPEHGPTQDGVAHAQQLVAELFANTLAAIDALGRKASGISAADYRKLRDRYARLDRGLHTETYTGAWGDTCNGLASGETILREWKYSDYTAGANAHRHLSHLMCLYPFAQIRPGTDLFRAAVNSLQLRGDGATGWSMGWKICLWAHAFDGEHAHRLLRNAMRHSDGGPGIFYNLYNSHAPFQIDGNFGICTGIGEMLMQGGADTIRILPALPRAWRGGSVRGLKAAGGFTVDIEWRDGRATSVTVTNNKGLSVPVRCPGIGAASCTVNGAARRLRRPGGDPDVCIVSGRAGDVTVFDFTASARATH